MRRHRRALLLGGRLPAVYAGSVAGTPYVVTQALTSGSAESVTISHPAVGYTGTLQILLAGYASKISPYGGTLAAGGATVKPAQASGETAEFNYTCLGDETSFTLTQSSTVDGYGSTLKLTVNGGANNGKFIMVGSSPFYASYANNGTQGDTYSPTSTLVARTKYGAYSNQASIAYSGIGTQTANVYATFGQTTSQSYTMGAHTVVAYFGTAWTLSGNSAGGGLTYDGTPYGVAAYVDPLQAASQASNTRPSASMAVAILNFKNDN